MLPGLKTRPGLHTWPVLTGTARFKGVKNHRNNKQSTDSATNDGDGANANANANEGKEAMLTEEGSGGGIATIADAATTAAATAAAADAPADGTTDDTTTAIDAGAADGTAGATAAAAAVEGGEAAAAGGVTSIEKAEGGGEGGKGCEAEQEQFPEPAVASETPLEDAIKAGLRHHPSFAEVDTATTRK